MPAGNSTTATSCVSRSGPPNRGWTTTSVERFAVVSSGNGKSSGKTPGVATGDAGLPGSSDATHWTLGGIAAMQCAAVRNARSEITKPVQRNPGGDSPPASVSKPRSPTLG